MANMLEGGGATPICSLQELEDMGYKIVAYPLSMLGVSVRGTMNGAPFVGSSCALGEEL